MSSIDWYREDGWKIKAPGGCGLSYGDVLKFMGSDIRVKYSGSTSFAPNPWGTLPSPPAPEATTCTVYFNNDPYTIQYHDTEPDTLTCTYGASSLIARGAGGQARLPSWFLGGVVGTVSGIVIGLLTEPSIAIFAVPFVSSWLSLAVAYHFGNSIPDSGGTSWTAEEGGVGGSEGGDPALPVEVA
jgi:hypothetical protein